MVTFDEAVTLNNQKISHLKVNGSLTFYNLEIEKGVTAHGAVDGTHIKCQQFKVKGTVCANNLTCQDLEVNGSVRGSHITGRHLKINGPLGGTQITVNGKGLIDGDCHVDGFNVKKSLNITGAAIGTKWNVGENTEIIGYLKADQSHFKNIELYTHDSALTKSTADNIVFRHCMPSNISRTLRLSQGTVVNGTVTFEDGEGIIYIDSSSKIKGAIRGGNVVMIKDDKLAQADQLETTYDMATKRNYRNHNGSITDEFSITVDKPNQKNQQNRDPNFNNDKTKTILFPLPSLSLILILFISFFASFALGAPLWLELTLGGLTSLCAIISLVEKLPNINSKKPHQDNIQTTESSKIIAEPPTPTERVLVAAPAFSPKPKRSVRFNLNQDDTINLSPPPIPLKRRSTKTMSNT